ncbi:hypothetical protein OFN71_28175, partial [Escherichia coli]|nr:hypothetical protein [Escherichia coli]
KALGLGERYENNHLQTEGHLAAGFAYLKNDAPEKAMCEDIFFLMNLKRRFEQPLDLNECRKLIDRLESEGQNYLIDA